MDGAMVVEVMRHEFMPDFWSAQHSKGRRLTVPIHFRSVSPDAPKPGKTMLSALEAKLAAAEHRIADLQSKLSDAELRAATAEAAHHRASEGYAELQAAVASIEEANNRNRLEPWQPLSVLHRQVAEFISYKAVWHWCAISRRIKEAEQRARGVWYCSPTRFWEEFTIFAHENAIDLPPHLRMLSIEAGRVIEGKTGLRTT